MHARHAPNGTPLQPQTYPGMQTARPTMQTGMSNGPQPGQVVSRRPPQRGPPRPGMFPAASTTPVFKDLKPGDVVPVRTMSPGLNRGWAGVEAGMGMAPRPHVQSSMASLSIGRGIDEAGYPMMAGTRTHPGMSGHQGQNQQQVYRVVPGMGPQGGVGARNQDNGAVSQGMVNRMDHLSVSRPQNLQPRPHLNQDQYPPHHGRSPPSSQTALHPSRSASLGGASISSNHSASTTRTASSSTESALNLRQHYVADPTSANGHGLAGGRVQGRASANHPQHNHQQPQGHQGAGPSYPGQNRGNPHVGSGSSHNPLLDLLSSEQEYVEQLTCVVRVSPSSAIISKTVKVTGTA